MKTLHAVLLFLFILLFTSCNKDVTIIGSNRSIDWFSPFTVVVNKSIQYADGTSQGVVKLQLFNRNNVTIQGLSLSAVPQAGTTSFVNCTASNSIGEVYCYFTATTAGTTTIDFTDGDQNFTTDIVFIDPPTRLDVVRVSNTQILKQTAAGYTATTGLRKTNWLKDTAGGAENSVEAPEYKLNLTVSP